MGVRRCGGLFFFNDTATTEIYTLSLHDALPISSTNWPSPQPTSSTDQSARSGSVDRPPNRSIASNHRLKSSRSKLGSSGNSVGLWVELNPATVEVDGGFEVVPVAVAAGGDPDGLDAGVEAFRAGVGDPVGEVGQQAGLVALEGLRRIDDRLQAGVGGPEVPAAPVSLGPTAAVVVPQAPQAFLDRPGPAGLEVDGTQRGEPLAVALGQVLG